MAKVEILLPAMGEGIIEATLTKWLVKEGDQVEEDQSLAEIATDKVDSEIPSPGDGIIEKLLFNENDVPKVGDTIAILKTEGAEGDKEKAPDQPTQEKAPVEEETPEKKQDQQPREEASSDSQAIGSRTPKGKFLSPLVRNIAEKENVQADELDQIRGSGNTGRITKEDILNYLHTRTSGGTPPVAEISGKEKPQPAAPTRPQVSKDQLYSGGDYEIVQMDRMRKLIADHMVQSKQISPHVTSFVEADVTNLVKWREKNKAKFQERENTKLTFTPLFIEATVKAIKDFPNVNVSVDEDKIILKKNINIGMATALPSGNLIVPVIKNADKLNLSGLASSVNDLANRARENKLKPEEIQGGTFTITNFGTFQNISGTPIINQPQAAILGVGSITKKPAVIETPEGDAIAIRHIMILSLAYDHRVIDGALGGMFLKRIGDYLEDFDPKRNI
ncbi:MAG: dihydrolipoamide acetyltransferase family protein [Bacteroidales bacterium]|jgi:2-oxoglutarate dehydrogenase E2 component (dihydrolipoamide succinyltransferase)|nr:dihydrolipoamide acetyltransferase family protein [Bacteroidales bacterium]